ncbi:hypothetical protein KS554_002372 [Salmonella enterica]|nr:hypothetical protein [Salmonella enterica]
MRIPRNIRFTIRIITYQTVCAANGSTQCHHHVITRMLGLELDAQHAMVLAQFVKSVSWYDLRGCALSDEDARLIKNAIDKLQ